MLRSVSPYLWGIQPNVKKLLIIFKNNSKKPKMTQNRPKSSRSNRANLGVKIGAKWG
jgi:hypothetical protein